MRKLIPDILRFFQLAKVYFAKACYFKVDQKFIKS